MTFVANVHVMSLAPGKNEHVDQLLHKHPNISESSASCQIKTRNFIVLSQHVVVLFGSMSVNP